VVKWTFEALKEALGVFFYQYVIPSTGVSSGGNHVPPSTCNVAKSRCIGDLPEDKENHIVLNARRIFESRLANKDDGFEEDSSKY